jgi:hypothetical protein
MFNFCNYKDIFGKPKTGAHSYRLFNIAIVDTVLTICLAYVLKRYIFTNYHFVVVLIGCFLLGIFLHRLFCVRTTIDKFLF